MNRFNVIEFLKLRLGTLFLENYVLPSEDEVIEVLQEKVCSEDLALWEIENCASVLKRIVDGVLLDEKAIIESSDDEYLGDFPGIHQECVEGIFPLNLEKSCIDFFKYFFDSFYVPQCDGEIHLLMDWAKIIVHFKNASKARTVAALSLLKAVQKWINQHFNAEVKDFDVPSLEIYHVDDDDAVMIDLNKPAPVFNAKSCDCYEYVVSGDCYCLDDLS